MRPSATPSREQYVVRHRSPIGKGFLIVSKLLLLGYPQVSDGAKLTYWVVYDHDWLQPETGERKGYVFPTLARLAQLRHATVRTIQRHLAELIAAKLISRVFRQGLPSVLYIEEPTQEDAHLEAVATSRGDRNVRRGVTKVSLEKTEKEKQNKSVNAELNRVVEQVTPRSSSTPSAIGAILAGRHDRRAPVDRREWLAQEMVEATGDRAGLGCYRRIASACPDDVVFDALALLKEARREGHVRQRRGALFVTIVRRLCKERGLADPLRSSNTNRPRTGTVLTNSPGTRIPDVLMNNPGTRARALGHEHGPDVQGEGDEGGSGYQEGGQSGASRPTAPPRVTVTVQDAPDGV